MMIHLCGICQAGDYCVCHSVPREMLAHANQQQAKTIKGLNDSLRNLQEHFVVTDRLYNNYYKSFNEAAKELEEAKKEIERLKHPTGCISIITDYDETKAYNERLKSEVEYLKRENRALVDIINNRYAPTIPTRKFKEFKCE